MLTVVLYFKDKSPYERFKILSNISEIEQEEYYIYFNRNFPNEKAINITTLLKYEIYGSGCLVKTVKFIQKNMQT